MDLSDRAVAEYKPESRIEKVLMALPEVQAGRGIWQNKHHQYTVYGHECAVVIAINYLLREETDLRRKNRLIAAACLHDIGKPVTAKEELRDDQPIRYDTDHPERTVHRFLRHEKVGEEMVRDMGPEIFFGLGVDQYEIADLVGAHYDPMTGIRVMRLEPNPQEFVKTYLGLRQALEDHNAATRDILDLFYADRLGQGEACKDQIELLSVRDILQGNDNVRLSSIYANMQRVYQDRDPSVIECQQVDRLLVTLG
jgi:hypothetical protein